MQQWCRVYPGDNVSHFYRSLQFLLVFSFTFNILIWCSVWFRSRDWFDHWSRFNSVGCFRLCFGFIVKCHPVTFETVGRIWADTVVLNTSDFVCHVFFGQTLGLAAFGGLWRFTSCDECTLGKCSWLLTLSEMIDSWSVFLICSARKMLMLHFFPSLKIHLSSFNVAAFKE